MQPEEAALVELAASVEISSRQVSKLVSAQAYFLAAAEIIMHEKEALSVDALKALKKALEKHLEFYYSMGAKDDPTIKSIIHDQGFWIDKTEPGVIQ